MARVESTSVKQASGMRKSTAAPSKLRRHAHALRGVVNSTTPPHLRGGKPQARHRAACEASGSSPIARVVAIREQQA